ncbi:MAG: hypothetical protein MZV63_00430 [Marinilabiliales bacterium]|nr:hypothetical protein [Marinilabiliales bacterium]
MTNFDYDIRNKVLDMSQRGRELTELMTADELLKVPPGMAEKPTFFLDQQHEGYRQVSVGLGVLLPAG